MRPAPEPPQRIGAYRVLQVLGRGGMATVYEGVSPIGRRVAVKILSPQAAADADVRRRFLNEARSVNLVQHGGLVDIYELGEAEDGRPYIVMEFLEGEPLGARLRRERAPLFSVLCLVRQVAAALAAAHEKGVVHRDVKPSNIHLLPDTAHPGGARTKVLDFGIAKLGVLSEGDEEEAQHRTQTGMIMGTPAYMSPEQCRESGAVSDRADVYSLGVILYQMLGGRLPFEGDPISLMMKHVSAPPPPLLTLEPSLPAEVVALVERMLEKDPPARPAMAEVEEELRRMILARAEATPLEARSGEMSMALLTMGHAVEARPPLPPPPPVSLGPTPTGSLMQRELWPWAVGAVLLAVLLALLWVALHPRAPRPVPPPPPPRLEAPIGPPPPPPPAPIKPEARPEIKPEARPVEVPPEARPVVKPQRRLKGVKKPREGAEISNDEVELLR